VHPDGGGGHELFIWASDLRDLVCVAGYPGRAREDRATEEETARVPFKDVCLDHDQLVGRALFLAHQYQGTPYGGLLSLLAGCRPVPHLEHEQLRGASYKRLAAIAHLVGLSKAERSGWYRVAESVPLSDMHARHILDCVRERTAA
jgi:hypothetical protein